MSEWANKDEARARRMRAERGIATLVVMDEFDSDAWSEEKVESVRRYAAATPYEVRTSFVDLGFDFTRFVGAARGLSAEAALSESPAR